MSKCYKFTGEYEGFTMDVGSGRQESHAPSPWIFIHGTDIVHRDSIVLVFFSLATSGIGLILLFFGMFLLLFGIFFR